MIWSDFLNQVLEITSHFNIKIAVILFLFCTLGEMGMSFPYVLETIWLLAGYNLAHHSLSLSDLLLIWCVAQAGRQTGSAVLYHTGVLSMIPLKKFYKKFIEPRMPKRQFIPSGITKHIADPSPLTVAMGRLTGLRIPMALAMSAKKKLFQLALGVVISSIIWDGIYIVIGVTVGKVVKTENIVLFTVGGLTALYILVLTVRYLKQKRSSRAKPAQT